MTTQDRWLLPDGIEEVLPDEARIDIISTGPDRDETIILRHPFA